MAKHTQRQWEGKFFRCGMSCWYCRVPLTLAEATKDHVIPVARGGSDQISNIVPACLRCNQLKGNTTEEEFHARRSGLSTEQRKITAISLPVELSLAQRDEPTIGKLRFEAEGGCSLGFKAP